MFARLLTLGTLLVLAFLSTFSAGCGRKAAMPGGKPPTKSAPVELKVGSFVIVSPSTVAEADRPSVTLTVELKGMPGEKKDISLKSAGTGAVEFESGKNPLKDVTVGTPQTLLVFGKSPSAAQNGTEIEARIDPMAANADAVASLTVIQGVKLFFAGNFECRLATDANKYDEKRGVPTYTDPNGKEVLGGWTFALKGEPDLDRIIRFSGPVGTRSQVPAFVPVKVTKIVAISPSGVEFKSGDSVIGTSVDLGSDNYFYGQDGTDFGPGYEPIANLKIMLGSGLTGSETQDLPNKKAASPVPDFTGNSGKALLQAGHVAPVIADSGAFINDRNQKLNKELAALVAAGMGGTDAAKNLQFRISRLGYYPGFMNVANKWTTGIKADKGVAVTPGSSQALKLMKIRLGAPATSFFMVQPQFYGYDGDALQGRVIGDIVIDNP
jgi:hypothetical protein